MGSFIDISGIPLHRTWTHARVKIGPSFGITATGTDQSANICNTTSGDTTSGHAALGIALTGAGVPSEQILFVPNVNAFGVNIPSLAEYTSINISKPDGGDVTITYPLPEAYTCTGVMPKISVQFDTKNTVKFFNTGIKCQVYPMPPTVLITILP